MSLEEPATKTEATSCTEEACPNQAEYRSTLMNDPDGAYCEAHALESAQRWLQLGFPSPPFVRLSDGHRVMFEPVPGRPS